MDILWWLAPPVVVTALAMLWVTWLGRSGRREVDRDVAVERMARALRKEHPGTAQRSPAASRPRTAAPASPYAPPRVPPPAARASRRGQTTSARPEP